MINPIDFNAVTACGECCTGCPKKQSGICQGCIETDGNCTEWTQSNGCPIHQCAREHAVPFCGLCKDFPCEWLVKKIVWRPHAAEELTALAEAYKQQGGLPSTEISPCTDRKHPGRNPERNT